ncbi:MULTISPECIES: PHP domain-containing protein [unclassified Saccharothrix]|uniref:PHP domain-containing protein n=1 Tax=unclassified Saccharothrix TaxID=2593673 RepID=UPI00307D0185
MGLPGDGHVHTEWSWDTVLGSMEASCARAVELGLPSVAFTEHADLTPWRIPDELVPRLPEHFRVRLRPDGVLEAPDLDVRGYLECVQRCRERFPGLTVLSGVELSEPHWHPERTADLLRAGEFDRVLGSVHALRHDGGAWEAETLHGRVAEADLMREYLGEVLRLVESSVPFAVLAHVDYPVRSWPTTGYDPGAFEDEFRTVLRALAGSGRALEVNTKVPLHADVVRWWREAGGDAVAFGSDAHEPTLVGHGFEQAAAVVEACGFRPGRTAHDLWHR